MKFHPRPLPHMLLFVLIMLLPLQQVYCIDPYFGGGGFGPLALEYLKSEKEIESDNYEDAGQYHNIGVFVGMVLAVTDCYSGVYFSDPFVVQSLSLGDICTIVAQWLKRHPERWSSKSSTGLVIAALKESFPLRKKQ